MTSRTSTISRASARLAAVLGLAIPAAAGAQQRPVARQLGAALATSEPLAALSAVRQLPGGMVLVNDPASRRVVLMDSMLRVVRVVADSTPSTATAYGARPGGLIAYRGDSTLFVDPASLSMLVIDPTGTIARVMAAPRPSDVSFLVGGPFGNPGFDAQGRLVYRSLSRNMGGMGRPQPGQPFVMPPQPDTTPLIRYDLAARKLDTAAFIKVPPMRMNVVQNERGMSMTSVISPLPVVDDWAMLPDGSLAIVRGRDYRVDVIAPDGSRTAGEKIAFDWQRLTDDDKSRIVDSTRSALEASRASGGGLVLGGGAPAAGGGAPQVMVMTSTMVESGGGGRPVRTEVSGPPMTGAQLPMPSFVEPSELPDYRPAFASGATRADAEGRLWVRTIPTRPLAGGPEYDVIDKGGRLVERVAIPKGSTIIGFGSGGIVYLGVRDAAGTHLVRARAK